MNQSEPRSDATRATVTVDVAPPKDDESHPIVIQQSNDESAFDTLEHVNQWWREFTLLNLDEN